MNPTEEQTYRQSVLDKLSDIKHDVEEVKIQTKKTNGRVTQLELDKAVQSGQMKVIRIILYSIAASFTFIVGSIVVPIAAAFIQAHA